MSSASLNRMSVNLATDQSANNQGLLMPKLKYRFRIIFENFGGSTSTTPRTELTKQVIDFSRPQVSFADVDLHVYNSIVRLAGKHSWSDLSVNLRDDASGNVTKLVGEQLQKQFDFMEQSSAAAGIDYKFTMRCEMLDGGNGAHEPQVLETWEVYGCYVKDVNYQNVEYSSSDPVTIQMAIRFDNAIQYKDNAVQGVGSDIGERLRGTTSTGV